MHDARAESPKPVYLMVTSPNATGGVGRVTARLANELATTHPVHVVGLRRPRESMRYPLDDAVDVSGIADYATPEERLLKNEPSAFEGSNLWKNSALADAVLPRLISSLENATLITTRPYLHLLSTRHAPSSCVKIAQEHNNLEFRERKGEFDMLAEAIAGLDQFVVLTEADADAYRQRFPEFADKVRVMYNPAPWPISGPPDTPAQIVMAAGTLGARKQFDVLIDAFQPLRKEFPKWQVHIYGEGTGKNALQRQINKARLRRTVFLKGRTDDMERTLEGAAVVALTSRYEGLPMVLIEAVSKGVPIVSFDCPNGPAEIVVDGVTGRLVRNGDVDAFTAALGQVMGDAELRARMSEESLKHAQRFDADRITQGWRDLIDGLHADRLASTNSTR